jgi:hypothetical protein
MSQRKFSGNTATNGFTPADALTFTQGTDRLANYKIPGSAILYPGVFW